MCIVCVYICRDVYNIYKVYIHLWVIWWVIVKWSNDTHTRTHFDFIRRSYLWLQCRFVTSQSPWLCGQNCTELHGRVKSLCLPLKSRSAKHQDAMLHDFRLDGWTGSLHPLSAVPSLARHFTAPQFPVPSSQLQWVIFYFIFPKYSWRIAELPCSPPYLLITLLSVNRPLNKTTSTLDITANSTYWCQTIVASLLFQWIHEGARSFSTSTFSGGPWLYAEPAEYVRLRFTHKHEKCITGNRGWLHGFSRQKGTEVEPQWVVREE